VHGAIAGGSEFTVQAGAEILDAGGNAVDAAVAACFAVTAGEPTLTSLAGGGVMLFRSAESGEITFCDFFSNAPGLGGARPEKRDFFGVDLDFGPAIQRFYIGTGSAAVPGVIPGLCTVLERWGSLPLDRVIEPACRLLRQGIPLNPWQAKAVRLLRPILFHTESGKQQFAPTGDLVQAGEIFRLPQLADTLERLASGDWRITYDQVICRTMLEQFGPGAGGLLTPEDLAAFQVLFRPPLKSAFRGASVYSNPPPATGGQMAALMLRLLETVPSGQHAPYDSEQIHALSRAMWVTDEARAAGDDALSPKQTQRWISRFESLAGQPLGHGTSTGEDGPGSTTHVSVIDARGNAAGITFSYGEGNGHIIRDTGIVMNNLMGEEDLFPQGFERFTPGARLSTMMSPTLVITPDGDVIVMGTGGSNRIRTALTQVIVNLVQHGYPVQQAVTAARVHFEAGVLNAEIFDMEDAGAFLDGLDADEVVRFTEPNLFFGGMHLVRRRADGTLEGAGDPRRGGACSVV
jgi:gamma-glutamyltranspeptidase/glutathione hydrolase